MAEDVETPEEAPKKSSKMPLILGLLMALVGGGGGFYATWSGMVLGPSNHAAPAYGEKAEGLLNIAFVEVEPVTVAIKGGPEKTYLHFRAQLEVPAAYKPDVELLLPRVIDVLNGYLRALQTTDIENPSALARLRAQMLRRVQVVTGQGRVNDLLIMEFVIN